MTRRVYVALLVATVGLSAAACTKVYNPAPTAPSPAPTPTPAPPPPEPDKIEFRVLGTNLSPLVPVVVRHTDPINGTMLYTGGVPYFGSFSSLDASVFLYVEAAGVGTLPTSTLQVQIFVNGRLFRDGFSQGLTLSTETEGTFHR